MNTSKLTYSRTIETEPEHAELLNYLVDRYVMPVMQRRVAQGAMPGGKKLTPKQELEAILSFGTSERIDIPVQQTPKNIAQGGLNAKELTDMHKLLSFARDTDKSIKEQ
ncbi:MAG: hypothetical protein ACRD47_05265 [Nitrososphaeraceae archaeon]